MGILLIFENKNPEPWKKLLLTYLPDTTIEVYPDIKDPSTVEFIICWKPKNKVFEQFPNLKVIQSVGAAVDHILSTQTITLNHTITRIIDKKLTTDMWEYLLMAVLSKLKNTKTYNIQQVSKTWQQHKYKSIAETTVSILGLGEIGSFSAQKFAELGFKVKGWSNSPKYINSVEHYIGKNNLDTLLQNTDFLINLLPLTPETADILNTFTLSKLPKHAYLINVGRGEHLVEADLISLIDTSLLSGAMLDVFRQEPLPIDHPFWNHPNIQITPHVASITDIDTCIHQVVTNYKLFLDNKPLMNKVSLLKGY